MSRRSWIRRAILLSLVGAIVSGCPKKVKDPTDEPATAVATASSETDTGDPAAADAGVTDASTAPTTLPVEEPGDGDGDGPASAPTGSGDTATSAPVPDPEAESLRKLKKKGRTVFLRLCDKCHPKGKADTGPKVKGVGLSLAKVRSTVRSGGMIMPAFRPDKVSEAEVKALHAWLSR